MIFATHTVVGRRALQLSAIALAVLAQAVQAEEARHPVYVVEDDEGLLLSDREGLHQARLVAGEQPARSSKPARGAGARPQVSRPLRDLVARAAHSHRLPPDLLHAVIAVESGYVVDAVSRKGAMGLMQLMPATARAYGVTHPFDPAQNVNAGAQHLRRLLDTFDHDTSLALAAYNAGAEAVRRHGGSVPPFAETRAYVPRVLGLMARLRESAPSSN